MKYVYACITYKCHIDMDEAKKTKKFNFKSKCDELCMFMLLIYFYHHE